MPFPTPKMLSTITTSFIQHLTYLLSPRSIALSFRKFPHTLLIQWFSTSANFFLRSLLSMSGEMSDYHNRYWLLWAKARDVIKHPTINRKAPTKTSPVQNVSNAKGETPSTRRKWNPQLWTTTPNVWAPFRHLIYILSFCYFLSVCMCSFSKLFGSLETRGKTLCYSGMS